MSNESLDRDVRMWGMFCHLSALACFIGIPFANLIAPLVIWLIKREQHPFLDQQGREALNFQISMTIYAFAAFILCFILIGIPLLFVLGIMDLVLVITAAIRANDGISYRYPLTIRFL
jgi:uncharacterized protein